MPPGSEELTLQLVLTGAGVTVSATLIASVIEILKRVKPIGAWVDDDHESTLAVIFSAILVAYAELATVSPIDALSAFGAFLAWVGIAGLAGRAYDVAAAVKASANP